MITHIGRIYMQFSSFHQLFKAMIHRKLRDVILMLKFVIFTLDIRNASFSSMKIFFLIDFDAFHIDFQKFC